MNQLINTVICLALLSSTSVLASSIVKPAPLVSVPSQDAFFEAIRQHCGKAFEGKVTVDNQGPSSFSQAKLVMHVRKCTDSQLQIPFHVGENASRTWIITKTGSGLSLKHDHRHEDGTDDPVTMYGGHTVDAGFAQVQSFPADAYSKHMFAEKGLPQSLTNIWQMYIYPEKFTYRLIREGREFRVDFDLTQPIPAPAPPWGYTDM
ncbi:hypothetical protein [Alteromonas sp. KUL49]|uniref:hypothetical protein n=1 Tax=Alteromonas sp. KUL49 TaxID=2480798 RepID=UPI00102EDDA3|nr:hypothetical protein [Alteromonas sp. KUL49]TAP42313.1 hypothetical protein EYS00_01465 [Alteromonas sp. KUL49]GEA09920.1 hypothetical protein KUL49_02950 [Alteromonas sp. KUL49]